MKKTERDVLDVVCSWPGMVSTEIAVEVCVALPTARLALNGLAGMGLVERRMKGRKHAWCVTPAGERAVRARVASPTLDEGCMSVLRRLWPDLTPKEWAERLHVPKREVDGALEWIQRVEEMP